MEKKINITLNGKTASYPSGTLLSSITGGETPCGGHGRCGKCKVIAKGALSPVTPTEREHLSEEELCRGARLACLTYAVGDCEVITSRKKQNTSILTEGAMPDVELDPAFSRYGVAVDLGTTTVAARLYNKDGELLAEASELNAQTSLGADVISRIEAAIGGKASELAALATVTVDSVIRKLAERAAINTKEIDGAVITGNTVMLSLMTAADAEPFSRAPFDVNELFGRSISSHGVGLTSLEPDVPVYFPPCIGAFVGADTTSAILSVELTKKECAMLVDIGTNGEMALFSDGELSVASTAAGPAFEGVGISRGMRGAEGAVDRVEIVNGSLHAHVIGEGNAIGICGTGLIDLAACLLDLGELDESGSLEDDSVSVAGGVSVTQKDVRMLQLAKSAISAGLLTLSASAEIPIKQVDALYVAGGFGSYLNKRSAARIGLLPSALASVSVPVGNAALSGASMLLLSTKTRNEATRVAKTAKIIDLSTSAVFSERFMSGMMLEEI